MLQMTAKVIDQFCDCPSMCNFQSGITEVVLAFPTIVISFALVVRSFMIF